MASQGETGRDGTGEGPALHLINAGWLG
jgi:hypothetical protein